MKMTQKLEESVFMHSITVKTVYLHYDAFFKRTYTSFSKLHNREPRNEPPYLGLSGRVPFPGIPPSPPGLPSSSGDGPSLPGFADSLLSELLVPYPPKKTHTKNSGLTVHCKPLSFLSLHSN